MRYTEKQNGKNIIRFTPGKEFPYWAICTSDNMEVRLRGDAVDKLAAYEDTGLEPDEIKEKVGFMSPVCVGCDGKTEDGKRTEKCTYDEDFRKCLERSVHLSELAHAEEQGRLVVLRWIPIESRPMTEEERAEYSAFFGMDLTDDEAIIYASDLPDDGDEILVCDKWGRVYEDTFCNDVDYGCGLEGNGDLDRIVAWMPKPAPYKPEPPKEETE